MRNEEFADFSVKYGNEEQKVHRVILANHSKYLERLFRNDFAACFHRVVQPSK